MTRNKTERQDAERAGRRAERWASLYLQLKGYRILHRRLKSPLGEIDLIARRGSTIIFVEVKQRAREADALESVSPIQQARIAKTAEIYLAQQNEPGNFDARFDILALTNAPWHRQLWHIKHVENAWLA